MHFQPPLRRRRSNGRHFSLRRRPDISPSLFSLLALAALAVLQLSSAQLSSTQLSGDLSILSLIYFPSLPPFFLSLAHSFFSLLHINLSNADLYPRLHFSLPSSLFFAGLAWLAGLTEHMGQNGRGRKGGFGFVFFSLLRFESVFTSLLIPSFFNPEVSPPSPFISFRLGNFHAAALLHTYIASPLSFFLLLSCAPEIREEKKRRKLWSGKKGMLPVQLKK